MAVNYTASEKQMYKQCNVAWMKGIRRVWGLPYYAHCELLPVS